MSISGSGSLIDRLLIVESVSVVAPQWQWALRLSAV
jgi:hypothetical protein